MSSKSQWKIFSNRRKNLFESGHLYARYYNELLGNVMSMFTYTGLPETIRINFLELYAIENGLVITDKVKGKLYCFRGSIAGNIDYYGIGDTVFYSAPGISNNKKIDDVAILFNNSLMLPDFDLLDFTKQYVDTDISEYFQILYSRLYPVPVANDDAQLEQYNLFINNLIKGKYAPILSKIKWSDMEKDPNELLRILNLTDNTKVDKLQYLSLYRDSISKRFWNRYGQAIQTTNKMAQVLDDEIHSNDWISMIYPLDKLKCRQEFINQLNEKFGTNATVDFSDPWKYKIESLLNNINSVQTENGSGDNNEISTE